MLMRSRITTGVTLVTAILALTLFLPSLGFAQTPAKLLLSQVETRGSGVTAPNEYIVIKNPGSVAVDLSNYYLTDATFPSGDQYYYNLPDPAKLIGGGTFTDFVARFPDGATIQPGQELSISMLGSAGFQGAYGKLPNFEMFEDGATADGVPDMRPARAGSIKDPGATGTAPTLSNTSEVAILFYWDGASDLVTDIDYVLWGTATSAGVSKTGISIDGPDADATATAYLADTPVASQATLAGSATGTFIRTNDAEGTQVMTGGNGVGGRNETSENLTVTFSTTTTGVPPGQTSTDTTPPTLLSASGSASSVTVVFSEQLGTGAATAANYSVYPTATPASTITVTAASAASGSGANVTLTLASPLAASTAYTVKVSNVQDVAGNPIVANSTVAFTTGGVSTGFSVVAAFQFGSDYVGVAFSEKVNAAQATTAANYSFSPTLAITSVTMQENGQTAIIKTSAALPKSTAYTLTVSGVTSLTGGALSGGTANFTTVSETVTNIATIQANPSGFAAQTLTMIGQVFVTASSNGTTGSAFIQDGSGRGLNVFGGAVQSALDNRGNVTKVTGVVEIYFTTTEITGYTATLIASGVPKLAPKVLTVAQMKSAAWEGTYIQTTATLSAAPAASGSSNYNYAAGDITFRVRNASGINASSYASGDVVTAAGFGSAFGSGASLTYQIGVGHSDDFAKGSGTDTTPPTLASATGASGATSVSVVFSEALGAGASTAANYSVYPTATPASTIAVSAAALSGSTVTLTLASPLAASTAYTVKVSNVKDAAGNTIAANSTVAFTSGGGTSSFTVKAAFQFGSDYIGVAFSDKANAAQATTAANYSFSPTIAIASVTMQDNGQTAIIKTSAALPKSTAYTLTVSGVTSLTGGALSGGTANFSTVAETVTNIATIQANPSGFAAQSLTMIGQVYVTAASNGTTTSAFIQDGSGRGLNVFGGSINAALNDRGNVAKVTGTVEIYFTTTEITGYTATLIASGVPRLAPKDLTVAQMKSSAWEGTYIRTTATLTAAPSASGSSNYNYAAGDITFRVRNASGIVAANFASGDVVTAAGFGSAFGSGASLTYQIGVGHSDDFSKGGGPGDTTPPTLSSANGAADSKTVTVVFSEALGTGANVAANYSVYPTASPTSPITVNSASYAVNQVTLTLASGLVGGTAYTVQVSNVQDLAGNPIAAGSLVQFTAGAAVVAEGLLDVPARTLLRGYVMPNGAEQAIEIKMNSEGSAKATCRVFDLQGRVVRVLYDGGGAKRTLKWNGRDETFEFVRAGLYICHLMTTSLDGTIRREQVPIVVSVRLD